MFCVAVAIRAPYTDSGVGGNSAGVACCAAAPCFSGHRSDDSLEEFARRFRSPCCKSRAIQASRGTDSVEDSGRRTGPGDGAHETGRGHQRCRQRLRRRRAEVACSLHGQRAVLLFVAPCLERVSEPFHLVLACREHSVCFRGRFPHQARRSVRLTPCPRDPHRTVKRLG